MSGKKITIRINDPKSIADAIDQVKQYRDMIENGSRELVRKMAETGVEYASKEYADAEYAGDNDAAVTSYSDGPLKSRVSAEGDSVLFIEFGTGITKADAPEARADLKSGNVLAHGEYGSKLGRLKGGWRYKGTPGTKPPAGTEVITEGPHAGEVKTKGNDATPAMYLAKKEIQRRMPELIKEAFNDR